MREGRQHAAAKQPALTFFDIPHDFMRQRRSQRWKTEPANLDRGCIYHFFNLACFVNRHMLMLSSMGSNLGDSGSSARAITSSRVLSVPVTQVVSFTHLEVSLL